MASATRAVGTALEAAGLENAMTVSQFLATAGQLTTQDRRVVVDQALTLLQDFYVHLPLKRSMHACEPVQRLRLLRLRLDRLTERQFHDQMIEIFTSVRDLHTNYILPAPFQGKVAVLPFMLEEFLVPGAGAARRYVVSKVHASLAGSSFQPGVEITHWNGVLIDRAVDVNAEREAGSNPDARHARGLERLTVRSLALSAVPNEEWVVIGYTDGTTAQEIRLPWQIVGFEPSPTGSDPDHTEGRGARLQGTDLQREIVRRTRKVLFNRPAMEVERRVTLAGARARGTVAAADDASTMPDVFDFRAVDTPSGRFGYVRIWTFDVDDALTFVNEFVRIVSLLPANGLIVDVRGNGGGLITAGEALLQTLTPRRIEPQRVHFINTSSTLRLCEKVNGLQDWADSIRESVTTGAVYSQGFPLTDPEEEANVLGQQYYGPVVLVTDALCYSTTDIFASGFQDHRIGKILGVHGNTGAGGANVWTHGLLRMLWTGADSPFRPLPNRTDMRIAIRQNTRVGPRAGMLLEDLGVVPDEIHLMTRTDVLGRNEDLIAHAARLLAEQKAHGLSARATRHDGSIALEITVTNLDRVDCLAQGRPLVSKDVATATIAFELPALPAGTPIEVQGYLQGLFVATRRLKLD